MTRDPDLTLPPPPPPTRPELCKPATTLYPHNLNGILESAIRATNAQYEEADVLKRLDVMLLSVSPGDTGWDVFSLDYHTDGPIRTVRGRVGEERGGETGNLFKKRDPT